MLRLVASVGFGLLSSRWLLAYLGEENFGTLTALGASGVFVLFLTMSLVRGLQREIAYCLGKNDLDSAREVFGSSASLFIFLAATLFFVMMMLRSYIVDAMSLPVGKLGVVEWVYVVAIAQIALTVAVSPYRAALEASQHLAALSVLDTIFSVLNFLVILVLPHLAGDPLLITSLAQGALAIAGALVVLVLSIILCRRVVVTSLKIRVDKLKGVFSITGWSMFGHLNWILRNEGSVFALNVYFGPVVNASYALALRLNAFQNELAFAVVRALQPALTGAVASEDRGRERTLTLLGSKLPVLASLFVWLPILFCAEEIFQLWLGRVPDGAPLFLRVLGMAMLGMTSYGHQMALESRAKLAGVTLWMTLPSIAAFVFWCVFQTKLALPFWSLSVSQLVVGMVMVLLVRPYLHGAILGIRFMEWIKEIFLPVLAVHGLGALAITPIWLIVDAGWPRLVAITGFGSVAILASSWWLIFSESERAELLRLAEKVRLKIRPRAV